MITHEEEMNELARRLAAAYTSHWLGYAGVDYLLKQIPEKVGATWLNLAEFLYQEVTLRKSYKFATYSPPKEKRKGSE